MATETEQDAATMVELPRQNNQKQAKQVEKEKGPFGTWMVAQPQRREKTKKKQSATMAVGETSVNNGLIFIKYRDSDCYSKNNNTVMLLTDATYE
ncbi:hypothetical protein CCACVL1_27839, partial [Corchorus capsularis]